MKKILTLMAAVSAATGAFAHDYDWQGITATPKVDANQNVIGYNGLKFANQTFSFNVNAGDQVAVSVNGKNLKVALNGTDLKAELKDGKVSFTATADGSAELTLGENTAITAIYVESDNYRAAKKAIEEIGKAAINDATQSIADYATEKDEKNQNLSFGDFYTAVKGEINKQAQEVATIEAKLATAKANDAVSADLLDDFNTRLTAVKNNAASILADAEAAKTKYEEVTRTLASDLDARIAEAEKTDVTKNDVNNGVNNQLTYINDFEVVGGKVQVKGLKAAWCADELAAVKADRDLMKKNAMGMLAQFPNIDWGFVSFSAEYETLKGQVDNLVARAILERDYAAKFAAMNEKVSALDEVLKLKDDENKAIFSKPAGYDDWKADITAINDFIAKTDNRRNYTQAELQADQIDKYNNAETTFGTLKADFISQATTSLNKLVETAQNDINDYSYKIAAKYQNEPNTQKEYEKKFAEIQSALNGYQKTIDAQDYNTVVLGFNTLAQNIKKVSADSKGLWNETLSAQKQEVVNNNNAAAKVLTDAIDAIRDTYNKKVAAIEEWKKAAYKNDQMVADLNKNLRNLFDIVDKLDAKKVEINKAVAAVNEKVAGVADAEFDPNNNDYRYNVSNDDKAAVETIKTQIETELAAATKTANDRAKAWFFNEYGTSTAMTADDALNAYYSIKETLDKGLSESAMTQGAYDKFNTRYYEVLFAQNGVGENYLADAQTKANEFYAANTLADNYAQLTTDYLSKVSAAVEKINTEYNAYKELYAVVATDKVNWSVAKANEATYVAKYKEAAGVEDAEAKKFVSDKFTEINYVLSAFSKKLEDKALSASTLKEEGAAVFAAFNDGYRQATDFAAYKANNDAKTAADSKVKTVEAAITNAKAQIADYSDEAKAVANEAIAKAETALAAQKKSIDTDYADGKLGETYSNSIEAALDKVASDLKAGLAEAEKVNSNGDVDYNGDGVVDLKDAKAAKADAQKPGADPTIYYGFLTKYLEYISK